MTLDNIVAAIGALFAALGFAILCICTLIEIFKKEETNDTAKH